MPETEFLSPPDQVKNPLLYLKEDEKLLKKPPLLNDDGIRQDGRQFNEIRSIAIQIDIVRNVTSSAYIELGSTKILCSVQGPRQMQHGEDFSPEGRISCQFEYAPFSSKIQKPVQQEEKLMSSIISDALTAAVRTETFPKLEVIVNLIVLENDGGVLTAAVLCAAVAMATSGIDMNDLPVACGASFEKNGDKFLCDPSSSEEYVPHSETRLTSLSTLSGHQTVVFLPSLKEVGGVHQVGVVDPDSASQLMDACIEGSLRFHDKLRQFLNNLKSSTDD